MAGWYYVKNDAPCGPVPRAENERLLAAGKIGRGTLVWNDSMTDWAPAKEVLKVAPAQSPLSDLAEVEAEAGDETPQARASGPQEADQATMLEAPEAAKEEGEAEGTGGLSTGVKIAILTCAGGGLMLLLVAVVLLLGRNRQGSADSDGTSAKQTSTTTTQEPVKPKPVTEDVSTEPVRVTIDFNPSSITTPEQKAAYEEGLKQGEKHVAHDYAEAMKDKPSPEQMAKYVKTWMQERNDAVQVAVEFHGKESTEAMQCFGMREGAKAWMKKQGLSVP
jgi:hypothetical protein